MIKVLERWMAPMGKAHRKDAENLKQTKAPEEGACGDKMTRCESPPSLPNSPLSLSQ